MRDSRSLSALSVDQFAAFYEELYGYPPYAWQSELLQKVINDGWPSVVDMPTGSGKTALIEIAVFALAMQAELPPPQRKTATRTFFVVDRRIVVDEADRRARQLATQLADPQSPVVKVVAERLTYLSGLGGADSSAVPLQTHTLRGGFYRTPAWAGSMTQPMIVTSTVDQVGSRMLFRGYGISAGSRPMQAALTGVDSLILLDEAHISRPFADTMETIADYQRSIGGGDAEAASIRPVQCVAMTATPAGTMDATEVYSFDAARDLADPDSPMAKRYATEKFVRLSVAAGVKGATASLKMAKDLHKRLKALLEDDATPTMAVAVVVNRVATAKALFELVRKDRRIDADADLMIGSMRPIDRDDLAGRLRQTLSTEKRKSVPLQRSHIVIATQCLEVGADFDFDHMICEAASIDALRQRFGRLNRGGRPMLCGGEVVIGEGQHLDEKAIEKIRTPADADPIYGTAMTRTFDWLQSIASGDAEQPVVDFGLQSMDNHWSGVPTRSQTQPSDQKVVREELLVDAPEQVALLPAHVDTLVQTYVHRLPEGDGGSVQSSPAGPITVHPDPDIRVFLHGRVPRRFEVSVCWRADLCAVRRLSQLPRGGIIAEEDQRPEVLMSPLVQPRTRSERQIADGEAAVVPLPPDKIETTEQEMVSVVCDTPPTSAECLTVSMQRIKNFLTENAKAVDQESDVAAMDQTDSIDTNVSPPLRCVVWRGRDDSFVLRSTRQLRPGDCLVFPVAVGGWSKLGHIPEATVDGQPFSMDPIDRTHDLRDATASAFLGSIDVADRAALAASWKPRVRLIPWRDGKELVGKIRGAVERSTGSRSEELQDIFDAFKTATTFNGRVLAKMQCTLSQITLQNMTTAKWSGGVIVRGRDQLDVTKVLSLLGQPEEVDENDNQLIDAPEIAEFDVDSPEVAGKVVRLSDHCGAVARRCQTLATFLALPDAETDDLTAAGALHDIGKSDPRFQAFLHGCGVGEVHLRPTLIAKSRKATDGPREFQQRRRLAELPPQWRHEEMSLRLAESCVPGISDLTLHCIASHHAHGRPFFPPVLDRTATPFTIRGLSHPWQLDGEAAEAEKQIQCRTNALMRFRRLHRRHGAWGLAYRETVVRLADWWASSGNAKDDFTVKVVAAASDEPATAAEPVILSGLDGSNPMAFLAAMGLVQLQSERGQPVNLFWQIHGGAWCPVLTADWLNGPDDLRMLFELWSERALPEVMQDFDEGHQNGEFVKGAGKLVSEPSVFHDRALRYLQKHFKQQVDPNACDYIAGFGSEAVRKRIGGKEVDQIDHSQLYMTKGSGHQRMLELMRNVHEAITPEHYEQALFEPWTYKDPGRGATLRWDPADESQYALSWGNPSNNPGATMLGANDLAIAAMAMFPTAAVDERLQTTSFARFGRRGTFFTWPMWTRPLDRDAIVSLLQWGCLHRDTIDAEMLRSQSIATTMRCERKRNDKYFNFGVATAVG